MVGGSLGVSLWADLTGKCTRVPSPSFPRKPSDFGREGGGVPSSFWQLGSLAAPCRSAGPAGARPLGSLGCTKC